MKNKSLEMCVRVFMKQNKSAFDTSAFKY